MRIRQLLRSIAGAIVLSGFVLALPASAAAAGRVFVRIGPPRPVVERRAIAPGPGYVWTPGFYAWNGTAYVWTTGRWVRPPRPRAVWVNPHWVHERRGWYFVEGHWR